VGDVIRLRPLALELMRLLDRWQAKYYESSDLDFLGSPEKKAQVEYDIQSAFDSIQSEKRASLNQVQSRCIDMFTAKGYGKACAQRLAEFVLLQLIQGKSGSTETLNHIKLHYIQLRFIELAVKFWGCTPGSVQKLATVFWNEDRGTWKRVFKRTEENTAVSLTNDVQVLTVR
jgi:hypothetical protein